MLIKKNLLILALLLGMSFLLCLDFLKSSGRLITFDGMTHMSNIAQYFAAIKDGDFPVRWLGGSANYGVPFGIFSQQTIPYLGAGLMFALHDTLLVYKFLGFLFAFLGVLSFYIFLREYVDEASVLPELFYFPGWKVYVDGRQTEIEFQDVNYRGVITYKVPAGTHTVLVRFENTKTRQFGNIISIISIASLLFLVFLGASLSRGRTS